jgi:hypothetical protein
LILVVFLLYSDPSDGLVNPFSLLTYVPNDRGSGIECLLSERLLVPFLDVHKIVVVVIRVLNGTPALLAALIGVLVDYVDHLTFSGR